MLARALSITSRRVTLERLPKEGWDLLVIGGGITGAGIALEAALRGLKVALVERHDFASGTSSKSSKLLHGGFRYLEHGEIRLVHEALTQRNRLFQHAPHLARELTFLFPIYKEYGQSLNVIDAGLWLYDSLASTSSLNFKRIHRRMGARASVEAEPVLRLEGNKGALAYTDGLTEDARMNLETLKTAALWGAAIASYVEVTELLKSADGKVTGARLRDALGGQELQVHARRVINAAGPWVDALARMDDPEAKRRLKPTKGVHLVTRQFTDRALVIKSHEPAEAHLKRYMFVIPYYGRQLIGTTDTGASSEGGEDYLDKDVYASPAEVKYVLDTVNAVCPGANLAPDDVISAFAGWRPLIAPPDDRAESSISREHEIFTTPGGMICIAGGKYTTFRAMGRQVVDAAVKSLREDSPVSEAATRHGDEIPLAGGDLPTGSDLEAYVAYALQTYPDKDPGFIRRMVGRYGTSYRVVLSLIEADASLERPIEGLSPETPLWRAEVAYFVRFEMAVTLADVMQRRTRLDLLDAQQGLGACDEIAALMSGMLQEFEGWTEEARQRWVEREITAYRALIARERAVRTGAVAV